MKKWNDTIWNVLYPRRCPVCHEILGDSRWLVCPSCVGRLKPIGEPCCRICGKALTDREGELCADCGRHAHVFTAGRGIFPYNRWAHRSILKYKDGGRREYQRFYIQAAAVYGKIWAQSCRPQVLIPVPMYPKDRRKRGFFPAGELARGLSAAWNIPVDETLIRKVRRTKPQKELDRAGRRRNVAGAFTGRAGDWGLQRIMLIDDVYTTGSTLDAAAAVAREHGVMEIYFLTVFTGDGY